ncbi:MAG TPA: VIT1/CCC1 transporter family protein [Candidatus Thermoplasmatota archaeon]
MLRAPKGRTANRESARPRRRATRRDAGTKRAGPRRGLVARARYYDKLTGVFSISRRYFVIGAFDGALTVLGLILGAAGHSTDPGLILAAGLATSVALAVSSVFGAFEAERVEQDLERQGLEAAMLTEVRGDMVAAVRFATRVASLVHGVAPLLAGLLPLVPFLLVPSVLPFSEAVVWAALLTFAFLFFLGAYLGTITRRSLAVAGMRLVAVALATAIITILIGGHGG